MELAGNEKRIQALFRELKFADLCLAPEFNSVWSRAQATPSASPSVFRLSFAVALSLSALVLCSLALWSQNWKLIQTSTPDMGNVSKQPVATPNLLAVAPGPTQLASAESPHRNRANRSVRKLTARHRPDGNATNAVISETVAISSWQSPTASLLQSPADEMLTSLPQLDLSVKDLKTFLPGTLQ